MINFYLFEMQSKREISSIYWLTLQISTTASLGPGWSQKAEAPSGSPIWVVGFKYLRHYLLPARHISRNMNQKQRWDLVSGTPVWDANTLPSCLNWCVTTPAPSFISKFIHFSFFEKTEREHAFPSTKACNSQGCVTPKLFAWSSIWVAHVGSRNPITWVFTCCLSAMH